MTVDVPCPECEDEGPHVAWFFEGDALADCIMGCGDFNLIEGFR